ncbi:hypothetical protein LUQ84_000037 [Hamiltosporidium tvaerminnensis]|nr:hypothetical protein LUQ84_000037 [Hamiltosporidium tvaerminnensis]
MSLVFWIYIVSCSRVINIIRNGSRFRNLHRSNCFTSLSKNELSANERSNIYETKKPASLAAKKIDPVYKSLHEIKLLHKNVTENRNFIPSDNERILPYLRFNIKCILKKERKNSKNYLEDCDFENHFLKVAYPTRLYVEKDLDLYNSSTKELFRRKRSVSIKPKILSKMINTFFEKSQDESFNLSNRNAYDFFDFKKSETLMNIKNVIRDTENRLAQNGTSDSLKWARFFQDSEIENLFIFYLLLVKYSNEKQNMDEFLSKNNLDLDVIQSKIAEIKSCHFDGFDFTETLDLNFYDYNYFFDASSEFYEDSLKLLAKNFQAINYDQFGNMNESFLSEDKFNEVFKKKIYDHKIPLDFLTCIRIKKETTNILIKRLFLEVQTVKMIMKLYDTLFLVYSYQRTQMDYVIVANFIIFFAKDIVKLFEHEKNELTVFLTLICNLRNFSLSCAEIASFSDKPVKTYVNLSVIAMFSQLKIEDQNDAVIVDLKNEISRNFFVSFLYSQSNWLNNISRFYGTGYNFFYEFKFIEHLLCRQYGISYLKGECYYYNLLMYLLDNNIFISDIFDRDELLYVARSLRSNNAFGNTSKECSELIRIIEYFLKV